MLPANYVLRAIPLGAGTHRLRLEYCPRGFRVGVWVSVAALAAWLAGVAVFATSRGVAVQSTPPTLGVPDDSA